MEEHILASRSLGGIADIDIAVKRNRGLHEPSPRCTRRNYMVVQLREQGLLYRNVSSGFAPSSAFASRRRYGRNPKPARYNASRRVSVFFLLTSLLARHPVISIWISIDRFALSPYLSRESNPAPCESQWFRCVRFFVFLKHSKGCIYHMCY